MRGRSYAAIGALRERLATAGVRYCVLAACNSRRLLRPAIYYTLDRERLFLPATLGIMNAGSRDAGDTGLRLLARADSHIESLSVVNTARLSSSTLRALGLTDGDSMTFVVSDIFVQLVELFERFVGHLDRLATSEQLAPDASLVALLQQR